MKNKAWEDTVFRVNLTSGDVEKEKLPSKISKKFLGGSGVGWKLAADNIEPDVDPLSPESPIIISPGVLVGTLTPATPKTTVILKFPFPATEDNMHFIGACTGGSRFYGPGLKRAGCDHLIVEGKAEEPVYLRVADGTVDILDASDLWGEGIEKTTEKLVEKEGETTGVQAIGTAGENQVLNALTIIDKTNSIGRSGLGAVMGSKNLKAIASTGGGSVEVADPSRFVEVSKKVRSNIRNWPNRQNFIDMGLVAGWQDFKYTQYPGEWPREKWSELYGTESRLRSMDKVIPCESCMVDCRLSWELQGGEFKGERGFGAPYQKGSQAGMLLDIEDSRKITHLVTHSNSITGLDFYTMFRMIDFVTRLYQRGELTKEDTGGLELKRDYETYLKLFKMTAEREGFGDVIADGWMRLKREFGFDPQDYWFSGICKGVDFIYDARPSNFHPLMMSFFTRPRPHHGGSHTITNSPGKEIGEIRNQVERWGIPDDAIERIFTETPYSGKFNVGRYTKYMENMMRVKNAIGLCIILTYNGIIFGDEYAELYSAATGNEMTAGDLAEAGDRIFNLSKAVAVGEGFNREHDKCPELWFRTMESPEGDIEMMDYYETKVLTEEDIEKIQDDYYEERGWDVGEGLPTEEKLSDVGLEEYASFL